jgi:hypothetical protein
MQDVLGSWFLVLAAGFGLLASVFGLRSFCSLFLLLGSWFLVFGFYKTKKG